MTKVTVNTKFDCMTNDRPGCSRDTRRGADPIAEQGRRVRHGGDLVALAKVEHRAIGGGVSPAMEAAPLKLPLSSSGIGHAQAGRNFVKEGAGNRGGLVAVDIHALHGQELVPGEGTTAMDQLDTVPAPAVSVAEPLERNRKLLARE